MSLNHLSYFCASALFFFKNVSVDTLGIAEQFHAGLRADLLINNEDPFIRQSLRA